MKRIRAGAVAAARGETENVSFAPPVWAYPVDWDEPSKIAAFAGYGLSRCHRVRRMGTNRHLAATRDGVIVEVMYRALRSDSRDRLRERAMRREELRRERRQQLAQLTCFSQLSPQLIDELAVHTQTKVRHAEELLVRSGDPADALFAIVEGQAQVKYLNVDAADRFSFGPVKYLVRPVFYNLAGATRTSSVAARCSRFNVAPQKFVG